MLLLINFLINVTFLDNIWHDIRTFIIPIEPYSIPGHGWHNLSLSSIPRFYYVVLVAMWRGCFVKRERIRVYIEPRRISESVDGRAACYSRRTSRVSVENKRHVVYTSTDDPIEIARPFLRLNEWDLARKEGRMERRWGWMVDGGSEKVDEKEEKWATREYKGGGKEESMG